MNSKKHVLQIFKSLDRGTGLGRIASGLEYPVSKLVKKPEHVAMIADRQLNQNDTEAAVKTLQEGMNRFPDSQVLAYKLAFALERLKDYDSAHSLYADIAEMSTSDKRAYYRLAKVNEARGLFEDALAWAVVYTNLVPDDERGHQLAYRLSDGQPVWRRLEILEAGIDCVEVSDQWIADCITLNYQMRRYRNCIELFEAYSRQVSGKAFARVIAAMVKTGEAKRGRNVAREYATVRKMTQIDVFPGDQLRSLADWRSAAEMYALEYELSGSLNAAKGAGFALAREFRWAEASNWYYLSLQGGPADARTHYDLAVALERQGLHTEAARHYLDSAQELNASNYRVYRAVYCLDRAEDPDGCATILTQVFNGVDEAKADMTVPNLDYDHFSQVLDRARANQSEGGLRYTVQTGLKTGEWELVLRAGEDLIARAPKHVAGDYYLIARAQLKLGDLKGAVESYLASRIYRSASLVSSDTYEKSKFGRMCMRYSAFRENLAVDQNVILYESNQGSKVTCNILPLLDAASSSNDFSHWRHYIVAPDRSYLPRGLRYRQNIIVVEKQSDLYLRVLATAKYLVSNNTFPAYFSRRSGQRYLNTWHGTPIKSMGKDIRNGSFDHKNASRNLLHCTHLALPNDHTHQQMLERYDVAHIFPGQVEITGSPRLDRSFNISDISRNEIRRELGGSQDTRIVLFAPTWRGSLGNFRAADSSLDDVAAAAIRNGWTPVYRGHPVAGANSEARSAGFTVVPEDIDTNDLLGAVDAVVTDYSSISVDAACLGLPVLLYVPDRAEYEAERGLCVDLSNVGLAVAEGQATMEMWFEGEPPSGFDVADPMGLGTYEDGRASERVIDFFLRPDNSAPAVSPEQGLNVLMFEGHFIPNGITAAAREANKALVESGVNVTLAIEPTAIVGDELRSEEFEAANQGCAILPRVIGNLDNAEQRWLISRQHNGFELSAEHLKVIADSYRREFRRLYGEACFDTVVGFEGFSIYWSNLMAASQSSRTIGFIHADMVKEATNRFSHLWNLFPSYSMFDALASVSPDAMQVNRDTLNEWVDPEKFVLVENLIDRERIAKLAEVPLPTNIARFVGEHSYNFVSVGRLSIEKGGDRLIDAFLNICDSRSDVGLVVVGDGTMRAELERRVYSRGHEKHVYFVGYDENPYKIMLACDCLVLASRHEGQGIVVLEALSLGKRIVATDIPGPRAILSETPSMLVDDSVDGIHDGMVNALTNAFSVELPSVEDYVESAKRQLLLAVGAAGKPVRGSNEVGG